MDVRMLAPVALLAVGCVPEPEGPTWHADVAPIVQQHCVGCHMDGGIGPFTLEDYATAHVMSGAMLAEVEAGRMPPWGAETTDECAPRFDWKNDLRLSDAQKQVLADWVAAGAPEGDPADAVPVENDNPLAGPPDLDIAPLVPWTATGDTDQFRCFVLDPGNSTEDLWVTGWQVAPGNDEVVHHALVFLDTEAEATRNADVGDSYECFGNGGLSNTQLIGAWAPGGAGTVMPPDTATRIPAGSLLVMQIHYHPLGEVAAPDATSFRMWTTDTPPRWESAVQLLGNFEPGDDVGELLPGEGDVDGPEFRVPAGAAGHVETMVVDVPSYFPEMRVWAVGTHMHYVGVDMRITLDRGSPRAGEPESECLVQTPQWDFNWQRGYSYDAELDDVPRIRRGDHIELRCTYDNTLDNEFVARALDEAGLDAPVDVGLGETTLDEMCLGAFVYATERGEQ